MDEFAVLMKSFEVQAKHQQENLSRINSVVTALATKKQLLPRVGRSALPTKRTHTSQTEARLATKEHVLENAIAVLRREGIDPKQVELPPSDHQMRPQDSKAALLCGGFGALLPSLGSKAFQEIQRAADSGRLPVVLQTVFGRHPAPFLDSSRGAYHRFDGSHDLVNALPQGIRQLGLVDGSLGVLQHLFTDSFGPTGIPIPGSRAIIKQLVDDFNLPRLLSPRVLSQFAAFRMTDLVAGGTTHLLLELYFQKEQIPEDSMRRPQTALMAHGTGLLATLACTALLGFVGAVRLHLNYVSIGWMLKHYWRLREMTIQLQASNDERFNALLAKLEVIESMQNRPPALTQIETEAHAAARLLEQL